MSLRSEQGMTIMEVVSAMLVGFVILAATLGLLETTLGINSGVIAKTDAMQRGRLAMDTITQQLRAQVCLDYDNASVLAGADSNSVTFYADYTEAGTTPVKRTLSYDPTTKAIRSQAFETTSTAVPPPAGSYPAAPTRTQLVLENALPQLDAAGAAVPFLRYYTYTTLNGRPQAELLLTPPLDTTEAESVARIDISYEALPTGSSDRKKGVNLDDQILVRHVNRNPTPDSDPDPDLPAPDCA